MVLAEKVSGLKAEKALISSSGSRDSGLVSLGGSLGPNVLVPLLCQVMRACLSATQSGEKGRVGSPRLGSPGQVQPRSHL